MRIENITKDKGDEECGPKVMIEMWEGKSIMKPDLFQTVFYIYHCEDINLANSITVQHKESKTGPEKLKLACEGILKEWDNLRGVKDKD